MGSETPDQSVVSSERELDYAYVHELVVQLDDRDVHYAFVRLVRPGEATPAESFTVECEVDVDADGHIIGVSIMR